MDYFSILDLDREPFSTTPDPDFFFESGQHLSTLQQLELGIRLKRGLSIVVGEIGTGKSTLCRRLIRRLASDSNIETHLVLDPLFSSESEFLSTLSEMLITESQPTTQSDWQRKDILKSTLLQKADIEKKIVVLLIDEGQKITPSCMEILREFLNFETNASKLLQIVLFAQEEIRERLQEMPNFRDRAHQILGLGPLQFHETLNLIRFRLRLVTSGHQATRLFTLPALWSIHRASNGYPRRIVHICHKSLMAMIVGHKKRVTRALVTGVVRRANLVPTSSSGHKFFPSTHPAFMLFTILVLTVWSSTANEFKFAQAVVPTLPTQNAPNQIRQRIVAGFPENGTAPDTDITAPLSSSRTTIRTLGTITLRWGDTLWSMIAQIYGIENSTTLSGYLEQVVDANPSLQDPGAVSTGQRITFPAIFSDIISRDMFLISLRKEASLVKGYRSLTPFINRHVHVKLLTYQIDKRLRTAVCIPKVFNSQASLNATLQRLAPQLRDQAHILHLKAGQATLYSRWPFGSDNITSSRRGS